MTSLLNCLNELRQLTADLTPKSVLTSYGIGWTNLRITLASATSSTASAMIAWDDLLQHDKPAERLGEIISTLNKQLR